MPTEANDWHAVEIEIDRIIASEEMEPFAPETIAQVSDFVQAARGYCLAPAVGKGYWSTIIFGWPNAIEIEVFQDRFELYRFPEGRVEIRYFYHVPGAPLPADLLAVLPPAARS